MRLVGVGRCSDVCQSAPVGRTAYQSDDAEARLLQTMSVFGAAFYATRVQCVSNFARMLSPTSMMYIGVLRTRLLRGYCMRTC